MMLSNDLTCIPQRCHRLDDGPRRRSRIETSLLPIPMPVLVRVASRWEVLGSHSTSSLWRAQLCWTTTDVNGHRLRRGNWLDHIPAPRHPVISTFGALISWYRLAHTPRTDSPTYSSAGRAVRASSGLAIFVDSAQRHIAPPSAAAVSTPLLFYNSMCNAAVLQHVAPSLRVRHTDISR